MLLKKLVIALIVLPAFLQGCGSFGNHSAQNEVFFENVPWPVSTAWKNTRGEVWIVPKRGVFIEYIMDSRGAASWSAQGSYVVIHGNPQFINLWVDGRWWSLSAPDANHHAQPFMERSHAQ